MKQIVSKKWKLACVRILKMHKQTEPIVFSRFGNDPSKSLSIPANMRKAKMVMRKSRQNLRLMNCIIKKLKAFEKYELSIN